MSRLDEIKLRLQACHPRPWGVRRGHDGYELYADDGNLLADGLGGGVAGFFSYAPEDIAWLLERVRELEGFIRLGLFIDPCNPHDVVAWQAMAKVALRQEDAAAGKVAP